MIRHFVGLALFAVSVSTAARADDPASLGQSRVKAAADAVARTLAAHFSDTINAADYGMDCDAGLRIAFTGDPSSRTISSRHYVFGPADVGRHIKGGYAARTWVATVTGFRPVSDGVSTATVSAPPTVSVADDSGFASYTDDNSAAMQRVYQAYLAVPKGAQVAWPAGVCDFSKTQHWQVPTSLRFSGMGIGATNFQLTVPDTDAFVFDVGPGADITLDHFTIGKEDPNQPFTQTARFAGRALTVHGHVSANGAQGDSGLLIADHLLIDGMGKDISGPGWQVGFDATSWARPIVEYVNVANAGIADGWNGAYVHAPNPISSPTAPIPPNLAPGQADDFWIHGVTNDVGRITRDAPAGSVDLPIDTTRSALRVGDVVDDVAANRLVGVVFSLDRSTALLDAAHAASAARAGATTIHIDRRDHANLQSGTITDTTTGRKLGAGTVSGDAVTFAAGGIASSVAARDVLSSGLQTAVHAHDVLASNATNAIDTVFANNSSNGGNVGLELTDFQGAYVSNFDAVYGGIEIRAAENNDADNLQELVEVTNSLLNGFLMDIDIAYVGGVGISNNNIIHSFDAPFFVGVWNHGGGQWNVTGNQFDAPFQRDGSAIVFSSGAPDSYAGFPDNIVGNNFFEFSNTCVYNDKYYSAIEAKGNSAEGCGTYVTDQNGSNDYSGNIWQFPTEQWTKAAGTEFSRVLIGPYGNAGALTVQNFQPDDAIVNRFVLDTAPGLETESIDRTHSDTRGGFSAYGGGTIVLATGTRSQFPPLTAGNAMLYGKLFCANAGAYMASWSVVEHYGPSGRTFAPSGSVFMPDTDSDTAYALGTGGSRTRPRFALTPRPRSGASPGVEVVVGAGVPNADCTADLHEMIAQ